MPSTREPLTPCTQHAARTSDGEVVRCQGWYTSGLWGGHSALVHVFLLRGERIEVAQVLSDTLE